MAKRAPKGSGRRTTTIMEERKATGAAVEADTGEATEGASTEAGEEDTEERREHCN